MNIVVFASFRVQADVNNRYWTASSVGFEYWSRYLHEFDEVKLAVRVRGGLSDGRNLKRVDGPGVRVVPLPDYRGALPFLVNLRRVWRSAGNAIEPEDVVSLRPPADSAFLIGRLLRIKGRPYGVEVVGDPYDVLSRGAIAHPMRVPLQLLYTAEQKACVRGAAAATYVTEHALQSRYPAGPSAYQTHCSDVELDEAWFGTPKCFRFSGNAGSSGIVFVGLLDQLYKGQDLLLDAIALSRAQGLAVELSVIGDGRMRMELEHRARSLGIGSFVHFHGRAVGPDEVRRHLDAADLFILPSRQEGLPRALVEAMARGLPCIGTTVGGIPELLPPEDMVQPNDAHALSDKILEVLRNPARMEAMSARNLQVAADYRDDILRERRNEFYRYIRDRTAEWQRTQH